MPNIPITIRIPEEDLKRVDAQCRAERQSRPGLFLRAMDSYLAEIALTEELIREAAQQAKGEKP